ncbi:MAG TPA: diguanylate cyclase [Pyrinomonadaceae bacterium]|nr:diguanylate cyclase [Pyrinomonadaceae bacterium]
MKLIDLSDYNRPAKTYWTVMVIAGASVFGWAAQHCFSLSSIQWIQFAGLLALVVVAGSNPIRIPNTRSSFTAGDVFIFLGVLFLGIPAAIVIGVVDAFVSCRRTSKRVASWIAAPAMMAVTVFIAGQAFYFALAHYAYVSQHPLGVTPVRLEHLLGALALLAMLQYFINGFTTSTIYALRTQRPILKSWRDGYLWTWWSFLGSAIATAVIYSAVTHLGWAYVLLGVPIIAATFWTYKIYFERVNAKTREAEELSRLHLATVEALATAIDAKDQTTHFHVRRVQIYAEGLGKLLHLSDAEIAALNAGALLHDVGKLAVPDHILNKPGTLTPAEFEKTKIHTVVGAEILGRVNFPYPVLPIVRHHHERWDGKGYPDGLQEEQIPITARIMSVVDCFDSVREDRPFRPGMSRADAIDLLRGDAGTQFDPRIIDLFIEHLPRFETEIAARGLADQIHISVPGSPVVPAAEQMAQDRENTSFGAYDQIRNAHREVYALYEIARTFGSSLEVKNTLSVLVDKVGQIVPFDTCVVYLHDEVKGYATAALAMGRNADLLHTRCVAPGEGVTGFALSSRRPVNRIHPSLDFANVKLPADEDYSSMASLPLFKDDLLLGALSVYSTSLKEYSDDQIRLLETVTRLGSDALANAVNHARAESNALTDSLTGLPNARRLHVRFEEEVSRARRTGNPFQVIMLDLDDFKLVNDMFGHKLGDRMLREVAGLVHAQLREYDFLARYAGDEFVAIVNDATVVQVEELRERIERAVSDFSIDVRAQGRARVGISVGSSVYGIDGETLDQLLVAADQAMYRAKSTHKTTPFRAARKQLTSSRDASERADGPLVTTAIN